MTSAEPSARGSWPRWPSLDGLRCLAILPVIWHHATPAPLPGFFGKGAVGVDLFFALSGFLITSLLLRERERDGKLSLGRFYARRGVRIFPLYYAVLAGYALYASSLAEPAPAGEHFFESLVYHATYTANWFLDFGVAHEILFGFSWSLCIEEQFYLVWPLLVAWVPRRAFLGALMATFIGLDLFAERGAFAALLPPGSLALRVATSFATPIGTGSLLAVLLATPLGAQMARVALGSRAAAPLLLVGSTALLLVPETPYLALSLGLAALVGAVVMRPDHGLRWLLDHPLPRYLGTLSYAAYLLHVTGLGLVRRALPMYRDEALVVFLIGLPVTFVLSALAHYALERPFFLLRQKLRAARAQ